MKAALEARPWLKEHAVQPPASLDPPPTNATRVRPFIFVYDIPTAYTSNLLQYRLTKFACTWRMWSHMNTSDYSGIVYGLETHFYELMLQSPHRTLDASEADLFYVPLFTSCYAWRAQRRRE
jgi:hypothetical protein